MKIRKFKPTDLEIFLVFAREFYATDSVSKPIPPNHMKQAFEEIVADSPYIDGFIIEVDSKPAGYAILCYTYSMEGGGMVAILDELYIAEAFQGKGLGTAFLEYMKTHLSEGIKTFRLEFVSNKAHLQKLYERMGFEISEYSSMIHPSSTDSD
ncbi:MAG: GNAT family N-acetyltransferase [Lachnospiraceae bacterium]